MTIKSYSIKRDLIRESSQIRSLLVEQFSRLNLSGAEIVRRANKDGQTFNEASFCRFCKLGNTRNSLTTDAIIYLCEKYNIELTLTAKKSRKKNYEND
jgi:hypothetical protein